jgi:serine/threonine-protein kinase
MCTGHSAIAPGGSHKELLQQVADGEPRRRAELIGTPLGGLIAKMLRRREAYRYFAAKDIWAELRELPAWKERDLFPIK